MSATEKQVAEKGNNTLPATAEETGAVINMIERLIRDPEVGVDKVERMMDLQERVLDRNAKAEYSAAMARAQANMGLVNADCENKQTKSRYASYAALDKALRPVYSAEGFALSFGTEDSHLPEHIRVTCEVSHVSGHSKTFHVDMPADGKGAKGGDVMTKTHAAGSAMSYGMRYLLKMIFNVAVGEDDDDGNSAALPRVTQEQAATIRALLDECQEGTEQRMLTHVKAESVEQIAQQAYDDLVKMLERKRKQA